ncbi:ditrans,polycis-undecaprenyl-diphosphate synthase ((2E,6E)-farnesyl-diphosphate specific) [Neiella marina]|uniref:Ditrans,polycis-undecaprenyl-diphosphate synthase ((2E,6E)-farnesyl-diphosphate specific) n=1 Tax=Neiella marina TaxID=508461 RepID=A0A8J2XRJ8_9GAMM|nr:polyprenyl diphosphate synthase [Neiella marina]GGA89233.1 ditrans,polycis-undecaprenyl-diphosphate synthase ((2E,6E)-farnesyl-diphosphate specific) [Neiella marina]
MADPDQADKPHPIKHVAIIMDGNGRWAQQRNKPRVFGHKSGVQSVRRAVRYAGQLGIQALTLYAFSSENWRRPEAEVGVLMELFMTVLTSEVKRLHKNNVRLRIIGDISRFSDKLQHKIREAEAKTADNKGLLLNIAANYGGRWDVVDTAKRLAQQVKNGELDVNDIDETMFTNATCLAGVPDPDLMIRTGGDHRISNFLIWQAAYTEFYFTDTLWPDFDETVFEQAIQSFMQRERRFGCTGEQVQGTDA